MNSKKALVIEAFMRIIIMIVLVVIILNIGKNVAEAFFGGSDAFESFKNFVKELNTIKNEEGKQIIISMDQGTAIFGFSKNAKDFRCYGCPYGSSSQLNYYSIEKPQNAECKVNACTCLCSKGFSAVQTSGNEVKLNCERFTCRTLSSDVAARVSLEEVLKKNGINIQTYPYWENGFFFLRRKDTDTPNNGMTATLNDERMRTIWIEKKTLNQKTFVAACPTQPYIPNSANNINQP